MRLLLVLCAALGAGCATAPAPTRVHAPTQSGPELFARPEALDFTPRSTDEFFLGGAPVLQGFFGIHSLDRLERSGGPTPSVDVAADESTLLPLFGGGGQFPVSSNAVQTPVPGAVHSPIPYDAQFNGSLDYLSISLPLQKCA